MFPAATVGHDQIMKDLVAENKIKTELKRARVLAIARRDPDLTYAMVASQAGVGSTTATKWIKEAGIKLHTLAERSITLRFRRKK